MCVCVCVCFKILGVFKIVCVLCVLCVVCVCVCCVFKIFGGCLQDFWWVSSRLWGLSAGAPSSPLRRRAPSPGPPLWTARPQDRPKFRSFFFLSPAGNFILSSLWEVFSWNFGCFLKVGALKCAPRRFKHHQHSTRRPPRERRKNEISGGRDKKKTRNFGSPTLRPPHPSGPHSFRPTFQGPTMPTARPAHPNNTPTTPPQHPHPQQTPHHPTKKIMAKCGLAKFGQTKLTKFGLAKFGLAKCGQIRMAK